LAVFAKKPKPCPGEPAASEPGVQNRGMLSDSKNSTYCVNDVGRYIALDPNSTAYICKQWQDETINQSIIASWLAKYAENPSVRVGAKDYRDECQSKQEIRDDQGKVM
jgi:hypothetical protein